MPEKRQRGFSSASDLKAQGNRPETGADLLRLPIAGLISLVSGRVEVCSLPAAAGAIARSEERRLPGARGVAKGEVERIRALLISGVILKADLETQVAEPNRRRGSAGQLRLPLHLLHGQIIARCSKESVRAALVGRGGLTTTRMAQRQASDQDHHGYHPGQGSQHPT